jgi:hypothetical protein
MDEKRRKEQKPEKKGQVQFSSCSRSWKPSGTMLEIEPDPSCVAVPTQPLNHLSDRPDVCKTVDHWLFRPFPSATKKLTNIIILVKHANNVAKQASQDDFSIQGNVV